MKKQILILTTFFLLGIVSINSFGQNKIQIFSDNKDSVNIYGISEFYFVHQVFADAFFMTDLYKHLDYEEMAEILKTVLFKVDKDNKVTVTIKQAKGPDARLVFFIKEGTKDGTLLALMTNFHSEKRKFTKKLDEKNSIARWYFIKGVKLVYRKDLYSEKLEQEKKQGDAYQLIDFYLFDSNKENDSKVKGLIDEIINNDSSSKIDVLYAKLYLGEYYLLNGDLENAEKSVSDLKEYFKKYKDNGIPHQYSLITNMAETELELMKRMKK
ncbi:MAG: hypothetical protein ACOCWM_04620 [Cyclobacteriaceae bacterium]